MIVPAIVGSQTTACKNVLSVSGRYRAYYFGIGLGERVVIIKHEHQYIVDLT